MSDNESTPEVTPAAVAPEAPTPAAPSNDLPDWARDQISSANQEAATNRVKLREETKQRKELENQISVLSTEKSATASSLSSVQADFDKLVTAIKADVPNDKVFAFAKTLQGANEDELSAHAAELKSMFGINQGSVRAVDRSQGKGNDGPGESTPAEAFTAFLKSNLT